MYQNYVFPQKCKAVIDVTKPPYNCDNTGHRDCTEALCRVVDDILGEYQKNFYETKEKLEASEDPNELITFEIRKINGIPNVIFPEKMPESRIIYFPAGTYLVSDTISYSYEECRNILGGIRGMEMNGQLRFMGQNRDLVTIKLQDHCKGFEYGNDRPVVSFMQGLRSNISMTNMFENITIDVGIGNPGATGIRYFANNTGAVRNVKIISSDPEYRGNTGFSILHDKVSAGHIDNLEIIGFDYGIKVLSQTHYVAFENIILSHQRRIGIHVGQTVTCFRNIKSNNHVYGMQIDGICSFVALIDAEFVGGDVLYPAVRQEFGQGYYRNVKTSGYGKTLEIMHLDRHFTDDIEEYCTHGPKELFANIRSSSLCLPVEKAPQIPWDRPETWVSVNDFGAVGDGVTDDTAAIQAAMKSGASTVYFQPGKYLIDDVIEIPAGVCRMNFMYCDLAVGPNLSRCENTGTFLIKEDSSNPLIIEDLYALEKYYGFMSLIEHACKRTLVISDVHVQAASVYFNTVGGAKVFIENTGCTIGGVPGAGIRTEKLPGEEKFPYDREKPCFYFKDQKVYASVINPERSLHEVINDGGSLLVFGFKTEEEGTAYETRNGGRTEVLGGVFVIGQNKGIPLIINDNSNVSVYAATFSWGERQRFPIAVRENRGSEVRELKEEDMPVRFLDSSYTIPLYVGRKG